MNATKNDYPLELAGAHGRIAAYRSVLRLASDALLSAVPYVNGVQMDPANSPWRKETAEATLAEITEALKRIAAELAVTNP